MPQYYDGTKLLSMQDMNGNKPEIYISTSNRSAGKTTYFNRLCVNRFLDNGEKITCCGDEPYNDSEREYVLGSKWLMHEAFCLYKHADIFKPYEKHHSTVKEACQVAEDLGVKNLILYHTEDKNIKHRKELYTNEGKEFFNGNIYVPEDLESFDL